MSLTKKLTGKTNAATSRKLTQPPTGVSGGTPNVPEFDPTTLFGVNDRGVILDFTDNTLVFQGSDGTTAVARNDVVGYATDLGPLTKPALQATTASKPRWSGFPRQYGSELATNGSLATDSDWTKGTGWTIGSGVATKSAGSASTLSQAISLTAGQAYLITFNITRSAGTLTARLSGGTTVTGVSRNVDGSFMDILIAATGNTTLEFSADATFAGTVDNISIKQVTAYTNSGVLFDGSDDFLQTATYDASNNDELTIVASVTTGQSVAAQVVAEHGNYNGATTGSLQLIMNSGWAARLRGDANNSVMTVTGLDTPIIYNYQANVLSAIADIGGLTIDDELDVRVRGVKPSQSASGTAAGGGNAANGAFTVGRAFTSAFRLTGMVHRALFINRVLTSEEQANAESWAKKNMVYCAVLGDSTVAAINAPVGLSVAMKISSLVGGCVAGGADLSSSGDRITNQKTAWTNLSTKSALQAVFVQIGLNDVKGRVGQNLATTAEVIADLQDLIDTINTDKPSGCKVYICGLIPCKVWLDAATNPTAAYQAWLDVNESIAGSGSSPITGVDARITSHVAALNDGSGNLKAEYDFRADGVHESTSARVVIAQAWRTQLEADSLVSDGP